MSIQNVSGLPERTQTSVAIEPRSPNAIGLSSVELACGNAVRTWLQVPAHIESWDALYGTCLWSTPFLSSQFFRAWTGCYADTSEPLLAIGRGPGGAVVAIMPLCRSKGCITGAGGHQAEYQGWLSDANGAVEFFAEALTRISQAFPLERLIFRFLPPKLPRQIFQGVLQSNPRIVSHSTARPLLQLDPEEIRRTLAKKATKSKLSRLKRAGELVVKRLTSDTELEQYFDQIIDMYDFRQGAINNSLPFHEDSMKRQFHLDWMKMAPEQLHVTVMLLDDKVISAHIGIAKGDEVHLAITAHSPFQAQHSPGKIHLYQVAMLLAEAGYDRLDLTPGGDWKERFATTHDQVHGLTAWPTANGARRALARERAGGMARKILRSTGVRPEQLRRGLVALRKATPRRLANRLGRLIPERTEFRLYRLMPSEFKCENKANPPAAINALADLCLFEPTHDWQSRQTFLLQSLNRLEAGHQCYTVCVNRKLLHAGWLAPHQTESMFSEINRRFRYPEPGAALYDFFTAPDARRRGYYRRTVCQMLVDLKRPGSTPVAYISVLATNVASRHTIENIGFAYFCSLYRTRVLWHEKHETSFLVPEKSHEANA